MTTTWNPLSKPTSSYTKISKPIGTSFTNIPKPSSGTTTVYGTPIGLLLSLTRQITITTDAWSKIAENAASWTKVLSHTATWTPVPKGT